MFDPNFVFRPNSPQFEILHAIKLQLVELLTQDDLPPGFAPPISKNAGYAAKSWQGVEALIANILYAKAKSKDTCAVDLSPQRYVNTPLSGSGFINLLKLASHESRQALILKEGFCNKEDKTKSRKARIRATKKFEALVESVIVEEDDIISRPQQLINLRKSKTKKLIPEKQWRHEITDEQAETLLALKLSLEWFNLIFAEYEITYRACGEERFLYPILYAVYTDDFEHGGRFYTGKGGHQGLKVKNGRNERSTIRFNGHETVELDYGGMHMRMLYHLNNSSYSMTLDPYADVIDHIGLNATQVFKSFPLIRDDLKVTLLALINGTSRSKKEAINRANKRLFRSYIDVRDPYIREEERQECEARKQNWIQAGLTTAENLTAANVVEAFESAHAPIAHQFSTGCGLFLQNIDAQIARWVMMDMMVSETDECVPTLPVHDSFITFAEYETQLRDTMKSTYQAVMQLQTSKKRPYRIPVKS